MERIKLQVPAEIRYISEWKDFDSLLPHDSSYIMNKSITGCGYTEYCIRNEFPAIICSPRKVLLENKEDQHSGEENVLYIRDEYATFQPYDEDLTAKTSKSNKKRKKEESKKAKEKSKEYTEYMRTKILDHAMKCNITYHKPAKFLVTYDSFRRLKDALGDSIRGYRIIVDEFQSIFCDSRFKPDTENNFLYQLKDLKNVCFLSATPMMDEYLEELDEFKKLPYYELDWETRNPSRVIKPILKVKQCRSVVEEAIRIVESYKEGRFERITREIKPGSLEFEEVYSKEAVIYVNSVKNICDVIKYCNLTPDNTNVLCSDDQDNKKRVRDAFLSVDNTLDNTKNYIGKVPKAGEPHKMFTFCTRTVYLGADFYSTNARSFILSDANVDSLSVDISLDLPQILGRQRLDENPWKNYAEFYYKTNMIEVSQEEFFKVLDKKIKDTNKYLSAFEKLDPEEKHLIAENYLFVAKAKRYKDNYLSVDEHAGSDLKPVFNKLVMISEKRSFEIQKMEYADRFSVFNSLNQVSNPEDLNEYIKTIYSFNATYERYRYLCSLQEQTILAILPHLPTSYQNYYTVLGPDRMRACGYDVTRMKREYEGIIGNQGICIRDYIIPAFKIGETYSKAEVKAKLKEVYDSVGYTKTPRAVDLGDYFIVKNRMITNKETGKRDNCYYIEKVKDAGNEEGVD